MTAEEFATIWNARRTVREAAQAAGMSPSRAHSLAKRLGLPAKRNRKGGPYNAAIAAQTAALRGDGHTYREISAKLGVGLAYAHRYARGVR